MTLGEIISSYRAENRLSMDEFALKSGLSKSYISLLEKNINPRNNKPVVPTLDTVRSISIAINKELNEIINMLDENQKISLGNDKPLNDIDLDESENSNTDTPPKIKGVYIDFAKELQEKGVTKDEMTKMLRFYEMLKENL